MLSCCICGHEGGVAFEPLKEEGVASVPPRPANGRRCGLCLSPNRARRCAHCHSLSKRGVVKVVSLSVPVKKVWSLCLFQSRGRGLSASYSVSLSCERVVVSAQRTQ